MKKARKQAVAIGVLGLLALTGCARVGVIDYVHLEPRYRPQQFAYAAGWRDLATDVQGNPFAMPQDQFKAAVKAAMYGAHFGPPTNFTTTPAQSARPSYRVRLLFNGPAASNGDLVCAGQPPTVPPARENGTVRLLAAFCNDIYPLSYLSAHVSGIKDADDPAFRDFMRLVTISLFPPANRDEQEHDCFFINC